LGITSGKERLIMEHLRHIHRYYGGFEESGFKGMICYPSPVLDSVEGCGFNRIKKLSDTIDALGPFSK
jgi:hypothetical protein